MGMLEGVAARVAAGAAVEFRPTGGSMVPLIRSRDKDECPELKSGPGNPRDLVPGVAC